MSGAAAPAVDKWAEANKASRDAAKWIAVALGAVGAAIFGGIPALKGLTFEWGDPSDNWQTGWAIASAVLGLTGIIAVIVLLARATLPVFVSLSAISARTHKMIAQAPADFLPPGVETVAALRVKLQGYEEGVLLTARQVKDAIGSARPDAEVAHAKAVENRDNLRAWAEQIRQLDAFNQTQDRMLNRWVYFWVAAAAIGAVGFMFTTSGPPEDGDAAAEADAVGRVALLTPTDAAAWERITGAAAIDGCADSDGSYLVLVRGYADETYTVQTIPTGDDCEVWEFDVRSEVADVDVVAKPMKVTVEYTPAEKSPSPSE